MIQSWLIDMIIQEEYAERAELGWLWSRVLFKDVWIQFCRKGWVCQESCVGMTVVRSMQFCLLLSGY